MKTQAMIVIPCILLPLAFASGLSFWAATIGRESASFASQLALAALPCGLLGMSTSLIIALIRSYEMRISQMERRLDDDSMHCEVSPLTPP